MPKINQAGFTQVLMMGIMVLGIFTAVYLSQQPQIFMPRAAEIQPASVLPTKIMPVGDSLTHGVKNGSSDPENLMAGYRYYLYKNLTAVGNQIDMVGNLSSGPSDLADRNHEGHNGYDCSMIGNLIGSSASRYQPDVVLLMCGVNDFAQQRSDQFKKEAINHLESVINNISSVSPNTKIVVATIVNSNLSYIPDIQSQIKNFNDKIPAMVAKKQSEGKKVYLVDMYNGLTLADLSDTVHPNETGYQKMSDVWQNILKPILGTPSPWGIIANYSYVKPGSPQTVSWFNLSGNSGSSWIGLYKSSTPDNTFVGFVNWFYLGNCSNSQGTPSTSPQVGMCTLTLPSNLQTGEYEFRLFLQGTTLAQKSNKFTVSTSDFPLVPPPPTPTPTVVSNPVNNVLVSPLVVNRSGTITVSWSNLSNPGGSSWFGLFPANGATSLTGLVDWSYMGSCSKLNGQTPEISGTCQFTIPSSVASGNYEIRIFLQGTTFTAKSPQLAIN